MFSDYILQGAKSGCNGVWLAPLVPLVPLPLCFQSLKHPAQSAPSQSTRHDGDALQYHVPYAVRAVRQLRRFFGLWEAQEAQAIPAAKLLNDWDANGPGISHFLTSNQQHSACLCDILIHLV